MTKKIFKSIILAACGVMLACICLFMGVLYGYYGDQQAQELRRELALAAAGVEQQGMDYLNALEDVSCRLTWVDSSGNVLYDSTVDAASMENHADREEIAQAMESGSGESSRYSSTLMRQTRYYARQLTDGSVLRVSDSRVTAWALVLYCIQPICVIFAVALILSAILADRLSRNIVRPLAAINLDQPLEGDSYEELSPILTRLERQRRQIHGQQQALEDRRREFQAVVDNITEGLVLLDLQGQILSVNPAALRFSGAVTGDWVGRDFIALERDYEVNQIVRKAAEAGSGEGLISRSGREYRLSAAQVTQDGQATGAVLLIVDVTEERRAERCRREFTANVSHELKTPLQTIMGSAELLEKGLVRSDDVPEFLGRIRRESSRLVNLIDDSIRLSRLDEGVELPREEVNLEQLGWEVIRELTPAAEAKDVSLSLEGEAPVTVAPRQLLHEIVYNLLDNAIKYNVSGGSAAVRLGTSDDGSAVIAVSDTGIGIAAEEQGRVFERFYRVDKSRSRQIGGTGLGLSIVKHAALDLGGSVALQSSLGAGTTVTVTVPSGK